MKLLAGKFAWRSSVSVEPSRRISRLPNISALLRSRSRTRRRHLALRRWIYSDSVIHVSKGARPFFILLADIMSNQKLNYTGHTTKNSATTCKITLNKYFSMHSKPYLHRSDIHSDYFKLGSHSVQVSHTPCQVVDGNLWEVEGCMENTGINIPGHPGF